MKTVKPNQADLTEIGLGISYFPDAWGCVRPDGSYRESIDPTMLWMMLTGTPEKMAALWHKSNISTGATSSYGNMLASKEHHITFTFFKVSMGWFGGSVWVGNLSLDFDGSTVYIGSAAGKAQLEMWRQLKAFLDGPGELHDSSAEAIAAVKATS